MRRSTASRSLSAWREAVLTRDGRRCAMRNVGRCAGPLAAHHVVFRSRDSSRRDDVDNGATLCRHHHEWVHANASEARLTYGLAGHAGDTVRNGRVVFDCGHPASLVIVDDPPLTAERLALAAARPRRTP